MLGYEIDGPAVPAWLQAIGGIAAVIAAFVIANNQLKMSQRLDAEKEARTLRTRRLSALHLAHLAVRRLSLAAMALHIKPNVGYADLATSKRACQNDCRALERFDVEAIEDQSMINDFQTLTGIVGSAGDSCGLCLDVMLGQFPGSPAESVDNLRANLSNSLKNAVAVYAGLRSRAEELLGPLSQDIAPLPPVPRSLVVEAKDAGGA